ncbi:PVC-type heme-binding CxxCH protein [Dyadobacter aurulentus]|uniref:PVC-type heme-binding CxxCH protein n=2 Tax=Pseudomonadati TaxID=3379134 RepID=UPI001788A9B9|nr:PVC-type heme-binding CxxCH protein [Dyadobacter sp. UC 10]
MNRNIEMCYKWLYRISLVSLQILFINSTARRPTEEAGLIVPEGFVIEKVVETGLLSYPMLASFDPDGRLFVFESTGPNTMGSEEMLKKPSYQVRLLEDTDQDGKFDKGTIYADGIPFPKGGVFYQGSLYVAEAPNLARYTDIDGDGVSDKKEIILSGWNFHSNGATLSGPFLGPDGWLYLTDARRGFNIKTREGTILSGKATRIWRCRPDGTGLEALAGGGFDNSIELAFMPSGETIGTMTYFINPQDGQRDAIMHWVEGGTYPKPNPVIAEDQLKLTGDLMPVMTKLARVAPSGIMRYRGKAWGMTYQDNLFTAEFNTGRIMRYIVEKDGSTFKTTNEVFLTSSFPDSHPTDVLQDGDGSMLVVVTGGWFSEGCPLSRVAKPDLKGGIYRIRKIGAPKVSDPYGKGLDLENLSPENLVRYLTDFRPAVRDKVANLLIEKGSASVPAILKILPTIADAELRAAALFALSRINSEDARNGVRNALHDKSAVVRIAAARALGLATDKKAVEKLCEMVKSDSIHVRRQAATALGQIGDSKAVEALLHASGGENDRVLNHAIIHALIILKEPSQVISALTNPSQKVRAAAMIALDQMDGSPLTKEQIAPALASKDSLVRNTGIWVAAHHPEWTDLVVDFLEKTVRRNDITNVEMASMQDIMFTFIKEPRLQSFITEQLSNPGVPEARKKLILDVIDKCALKELPDSWIKGIGQLLYSREPSLRSRVFALIESRRINALKNNLDQLISDPKLSPDIRLKALSARVITLPQLSDNEFDLLMKCLGPENNSPLRQRAVRVLGYTEPTDFQLLRIAQVQIPHADPFLLPGLMQVFEGSASEQVGNALVTGMEAGIGRLDNVSEQDLQRLLKTFPASVHSRSEPLMARIRAKNSERLSHLKQLESKLKGGDVGEGRKLFFGKASCYLCHSVGPEGGRFGPDLTNIGEIRSKHDMLEAIVYPSASFAREYETFRVVTNTTAYVGIIKEELPDVIVLEVGPAPGLRIARSEIKSIEPHTTSMMPPGLDQTLTISEMANLTAFLEALPYRIDRMLKNKENR